MSLKTKLFFQAIGIGIVVGVLFSVILLNILLGAIVGVMTFGGFLVGSALTIMQLD